MTEPPTKTRGTNVSDEPETVTLRWCPECGYFEHEPGYADVHPTPTGTMRCDGAPQSVTYDLRRYDESPAPLIAKLREWVGDTRCDFSGKARLYAGGKANAAEEVSALLDEHEKGTEG